MSVVLTIGEATDTRDCVTPGCTGIARKGEFCDTCKTHVSARARRRIWQRAEMRRQAELQAERDSARVVDELARRRRVRQQRRDMILDGRTRAVHTIRRLQEQATKRGDAALAEGLDNALVAITETLVGRKIAP